ncbi:MAG TPA: alanine racemase [Bacteroidota bacterium]
MSSRTLLFAIQTSCLDIGHTMIRTSQHSEHPTQARINLSAFRHNIEAVRLYTGRKTRIMAVVKANGYGHGMVEMSRAAVEAGVEFLSVARVDEALELRAAGITHPVLVFELPRKESIEPAINEKIDLTVGSIEGAREIDFVASRLRERAVVHIKVDTGMGRLGLNYLLAETEIELIHRCTHLHVAGIYSHFANSEVADQSFAKEQLKRFTSLLETLKRKGIEIPIVHMANSAAIMTLPEAHFTMVRPGLMLYGYPPAVGLDKKYPLEPVMSLVSQISFLKSVEPGVSISYSRRFVTKKRTKIGTVPIGYADGYSRMLTGKTEVLVRGNRVPVVGTICMDHLMIDLGDMDSVHEGEPVTFIGKDRSDMISAWDIAEKLGTIPYEVTCMVSKRVKRIFVG